MKRLSLGLLLLVAATNFAIAQQNPQRNSMEVKDVGNAYNPKEWIISEKEEPKNDHELKKYPETDIKGVISCYDENYLRVDILLHNPVTGKYPTVFAIRLEYSDDYSEVYLYFADTKEFYIYYFENGELTDSECLSDKEDATDFAEITSSAGKNNTDVIFIINKDVHLTNEKGSKIYLTLTAATSLYDEDSEDKFIPSDETISVDLYFKM